MQEDRRRRAPPSDGPIINTPLEIVVETEAQGIEKNEDKGSCGVKRQRLPGGRYREHREHRWHREQVFMSERRLCGLLPTDRMILSNCR